MTMTKGSLFKVSSGLVNSIERIEHDLKFIRTHMSSYLGDGIAITYLEDCLPIYVNSNDYGGPANLINGGRYEEENLALLLSFVRDDTVFVDVGANLGYFAAKIGQRVRPRGRVYAFEPHRRLVDLMQRTVFLNGLANVVTCYAFGLSDTNRAAAFAYPPGHLGGGAVSAQEIANFSTIQSEVKTLDSVFGPNFTCDLMKIDVEGHELRVIKGMTNVLKNSRELKILFEKLVTGAGYEEELYNLLTGSGYHLYAVNSNISLSRLDSLSLKVFSGYVLAAREGSVVEGESYYRFSIYPNHLSTTPPARFELSSTHLLSSGQTGEILFHGPYWYLPKGVWRFVLHGEVKGKVSITFANRFGIESASFELSQDKTEDVAILDHDLLHFECVARSGSNHSSICVEKIDLMRVG